VSCVVDASVAAKWFFATEPHAAEALALARDDPGLVAPDLVVAEICNAAWKSMRLGRIELANLEEIAATLPRYFAELVGVVALAPRASAIAAQLDHPVYDCFYLALAEARRLPLVTADTRLLAKLAGSAWSASAVRLADYRSGA
jgi:predicted nucleic acid-binding protein